jgi:hypothetical protein
MTAGFAARISSCPGAATKSTSSVKRAAVDHRRNAADEGVGNLQGGEQGDGVAERGSKQVLGERVARERGLVHEGAPERQRMVDLAETIAEAAAEDGGGTRRHDGSF